MPAAMVEKSYPDCIPYLSTCKSPQMMLGAVIKNYFAQMHEKKPGDISMISIMPCVRKQGAITVMLCGRSGVPLDVFQQSGSA